MGIVNVTPDSFSDGGQLNNEQALIARVGDMIAAGADILDIGGESSRPFAAPVSAEEELNRVLPAIRAIRRRFCIPLSIDTTKAVVAEAALEAGADIINDISALRFDPQMIALACETGAPLIMMHMRGTPRDMQLDPVYQDVVAEIYDFFRERIQWVEAHGVGREKLILDPGLGFGKTVAHNLTILKHLPVLQKIGLPLLVGHSRKGFIGKTLGIDAAEGRDGATAVLSAYCAHHNIAIVRVHDVRQTAQALHLLDAIQSAP